MIAIMLLIKQIIKLKLNKTIVIILIIAMLVNKVEVVAIL